MGRKQELEALNSELIDFLTAIRDRIDAKLDEAKDLVAQLSEQYQKELAALREDSGKTTGGAGAIGGILDHCPVDQRVWDRALDVYEMVPETSPLRANAQIQSGLILEAIAVKEGISVSQEDMNNEVTRLATELRVPVAELVKMIQAGGQDSIEELRARILADKALDFVYRNSVIQG